MVLHFTKAVYDLWHQVVAICEVNLEEIFIDGKWICIHSSEIVGCRLALRI